MVWDKLHIAAPFYKGLELDHLSRIDFIQTWARVCRFQIEYCHQNVEAVESSKEDKTHLGIPVGRPILKTTEVFHAVGGKLAGIFVSHYDSKRFYISSTFDWRTGSSISKVSPLR